MVSILLGGIRNAQEVSLAWHPLVCIGSAVALGFRFFTDHFSERGKGNRLQVLKYHLY
jgi:hypothetical protein